MCMFIWIWLWVWTQVWIQVPNLLRDTSNVLQNKLHFLQRVKMCQASSPLLYLSHDPHLSLLLSSLLCFRTWLPQRGAPRQQGPKTTLTGIMTKDDNHHNDRDNYHNSDNDDYYDEDSDHHYHDDHAKHSCSLLSISNTSYCKIEHHKFEEPGVLIYWDLGNLDQELKEVLSHQRFRFLTWLLLNFSFNFYPMWKWYIFLN